jgi:hypothetical protein
LVRRQPILPLERHDRDWPRRRLRREINPLQVRRQSRNIRYRNNDAKLVRHLAQLRRRRGVRDIAGQAQEGIDMAAEILRRQHRNVSVRPGRSTKSYGFRFRRKRSARAGLCGRDPIRRSGIGMASRAPANPAAAAESLQDPGGGERLDAGAKRAQEEAAMKMDSPTIIGQRRPYSSPSRP